MDIDNRTLDSGACIVYYISAVWRMYIYFEILTLFQIWETITFTKTCYVYRARQISWVSVYCDDAAPPSYCFRSGWLFQLSCCNSRMCAHVMHCAALPLVLIFIWPVWEAWHVFSEDNFCNMVRAVLGLLTRTFGSVISVVNRAQRPNSLAEI